MFFSLSLTQGCLQSDEESEYRELFIEMMKDEHESAKQHFSEDFHRPRVPSQPNTSVLFPEQLKGVYIGMKANDLFKLRPNISPVTGLENIFSTLFDFIMTNYMEAVEQQEKEGISRIWYCITKSRLVGVRIAIASNEQNTERKKLITEKYVKRYCQVSGDPKSVSVLAPANGYGAILEWQDKNIFINLRSYRKKNSDLRLSSSNSIAIGSMSAYSAMMRTCLHRAKNMSPSEQVSTVKQIYPYLESLLTDQTLDGLLAAGNPHPIEQ